MWLSVSTPTQWDRVSAVFPLRWSSASCLVLSALCKPHLELELELVCNLQKLSSHCTELTMVFCISLPLLLCWL